MTAGALVVVGTGMRLEGQITAEARSAIVHADRVFYLLQDVVTQHWIEELQPAAESLADAYASGRARQQSYGEMVERILAPVREGRRVCVAFYGHPGVFVRPAHEAIRRAHQEGHAAEMLPGVSAEDCMIADLGFDPGDGGCQSFEATDFLIRRRRFDPTSHLILWQIGGIGVADFREGELWNPRGLAILAEELERTYGGAHEVVVYEAALYPIADPLRLATPLAELPQAPVTLASTLYVPPLPQRAGDPALRAALGMPPDPND